MGGITLLHMASLEQAPEIESFNDRWWTTMRSRHRFGDEQIKSITGDHAGRVTETALEFLAGE